MFEQEQKLFLEFIKLINDPDFTQEKAEHALELALKVYSGGWRHSYGVVTKYFLANSKGNSSSLSDTLQICYENLKQVHDILAAQQDEPKTRRSLEKLLDHIDLEIVRFDYFGKGLQTLQDQTEYTKSQISKIEQASDNAQQEIKNQKIQSVTILGIFASIVITFVAGISVTNALLTNIQELSKWSMSFWSVLILGGVVNVLYSLYNMLYRLSGNKDKIIKWWSNWFNIGLFVFAIIFLSLSIATTP